MYATVTIQPFFSDGAVYQSLLLALGIGYAILLHYFRSSVGSLFKMLRSKNYTGKLMDEANYTFALFIRLISGLGVLGMGFAVVRGVEILAPGISSAGIAPWMREAAVPLVAGVVLLVRLLGTGVVLICGGVTMNGEAARRLLLLRRLVWAVATVAATPALLVAAAGSGTAQYVMFWLVAGLFVVAACLTAYKTYVLFMEQSAPTLLWILYLCVVEIFPVSLVIAIAMKTI